MDDSSSEEEEVVESTETKEHLKETDANKSSGDEEEPPLNSDDDGEDENAETIFETDNIVLCQFDKVKNFFCCSGFQESKVLDFRLFQSVGDPFLDISKFGRFHLSGFFHSQDFNDFS
ncbi:unnamed protein product [Meloidogyne enterolobii]|uniref:Uncharacterized protein n=1 Tax=Meloidogyne enterolobii TaxID=390850 RepID=A0ACB0ZSL8_MELEN